MTGKNPTHSRQLVKKILLFLSILILSSCASDTYRAEGFDYSPSDVKKAIADNIQGGLARVESNGRVFYSRAFGQGEKQGQATLIMRITILGDEHPYDLDIAVHRVDPAILDRVSAFDQGEPFRGQDSLAKRVVIKINDELAKRRKNRNMFDDFRPF